jgi:putative MATE family efflux protein
MGQTKGVKTLLGNPRKAVLKLAMPMILAMSVMTIYNLVDAFWVSGLGAGALAAVGFFFPFFFMVMAIATGIGTGGGAAISRRIGAKDRGGADSVGAHTIIIMVLMAVMITIPFFLLVRPIFLGIGAESTIDDTVAYARVLFAGTIIIFFANVSNALLRGEGDARRAMLAMVLGGVMNIILDPLFIFGPTHPGPIFGGIGLDLGVVGAAWATLVSLSITSALLFYWLFLKKNTFVRFRFRGFRFDREILHDITRVGLPASVQQLSMSFTMILMNIIIVGVAGSDGVAVYTTGWRVSTLGILPLLGIATAVVSVSGAAYGQKDYDKLNMGHNYAVKLGTMIEIVVAAFIFIFAAGITFVFTQSPDTVRIAPDLVQYFQITAIFYPGVAFGMLSGALFQGTGKGMYSLATTLFRTVIMTPPLALLFAYTFEMGLVGIWWGFVIANTIASLIAFIWAKIYIRKLKKNAEDPVLAKPEGPSDF